MQLQDRPTQGDILRMVTPPQSTTQIASATVLLDADALVDAPFLFKDFHEDVIPLIMAMR